MGETPDIPDVPAFDGGTRYTMAEAAHIKGVSYHTVSRAVRSGKLPAQRLGRMALISAADLQEWRPMRERAPRKYRKSDPEYENGALPVKVAASTFECSGDRLMHAAERLMVAASAESVIDFGRWLAHWLAHTLGAETAVIWKLDEPRNRVTLLGAVGVGEVELPAVMDGAAARALRDVSDQEDAVLLDARAADKLRAGDWLGPMEGGQPAVVPLRSGSRSVGCAVVVWRGQRPPLSPGGIAFAQRLGLYAAFAMEHLEMRQAKRSASVTLESVLQGLPVQIVAVDSNGTVIYANRAFTDAWGERYYERYAGRHYSHLQRSYRVETLDGVEVRLEDNPLTVALRGERADRATYLVPDAPGSTQVFDINAMPTYDENGLQTGAIMAIREASAAKFVDDDGGQSPVEQLLEARRRVELLASLSTEIAARRGSEDIFELIASRAAEILQADASMVMTPAAHNTFVPRATHNRPANLVGRQLNRFAFPSAVLAMAHRDIQYVSEDEANPVGVQLLREIGGHAALLVPLVDGDESLGILGLYYRDIDTLRRVDPDLARTVGQQCGNAIQLHNVVVELEASRRRLQTTLAQLPQAVVITDEHEGNIVAMNREAQALWGASARWLGRHASDIPVLDEQGQHYPPDRHPFLRPLRTRQAEFGVPVVTQNVDGEQIDVIGNMAAIVGQNGELRGTVAVLQRREHFKPIDRAKDEFISVVAHELRNPLTSLRGNLQMLKRRLDRMETEEARHEVDRVAGVIEQVDRIGDLVSRMLDVSRADLGKLTIAPTPTDAVRLVRGVTAQLESQLAGRNVNIHAPDELPVEWDEVRIQQILMNLLTNAMRYAPEGDIDVTVTPGEGDTVRISVRDRGSGVPLHLRRRLFRLYYRGEGGETPNGAAGHTRGLGIGLYISARLAEAHRGNLRVDDAEGGGAIFALTLPRLFTPQS